MKLKHFAGLFFIIAVGGFAAYKVLCSKGDNVNDYTSEKNDNDSSVNKNEIVEEPVDDFFESEKQCEKTMHNAYENMNLRNEQAKQILSDIHDDMKRSEDNIATKKDDIAKMMENLKK